MDSSTSDLQKPRIAAIIVAAGRGARAGSSQGPKQYRSIGGRAIIARTIEAFSSHPDISSITIVIHRDDQDLHRQAAGEPGERVCVVFGGETRQQSVLQGLLSLADNAPDFVLIHDGARPFIDKDTIDRTIAAVTHDSGALPAMAISDTLKRTKDDGVIADTVPRDRLFGAQTPQAFPFGKILDAHKSAAERRLADFTDDAAIAEWAGLPVRVVQGAADNVKLTWAQDIEMADRRLNEKAVRFPDVRTGNGYDVHAFEPGDYVTLCGVAIPHHVKLVGHSDADVGLHALTDALLATCGAGDIGTHFPPSDPQWKGAASHLFVEHAVSIVRAKGGRIANADITLICEAPRIGPHREAMTAALAGMLAIEAGRVSIKATTNERLGFIGREEGIVAIATTTVVFPGEVP